MKRAHRGFGPHLPGSLVLAALLVAVVVSRVAQPSRSDAAGALYSAAAAWTITAEGATHCGTVVDTRTTWFDLVMMEPSGNQGENSLFVHGPQSCRACFDGADPPWNAEPKSFSAPNGEWRIRPNPGYWGSPNPGALVLGFSKGPGQVERVRGWSGGAGFEKIPFNDTRGQMRPNLHKLLVAIGLTEKARPIESLFRSDETLLGFASIVRCSVEMMVGDSWKASGGSILAKTVKARPAFLRECVDRHIRRALPSSVELIVLLGADVRYVEEMRKALAGSSSDPNVSYVYQALGRTVVHVPHPSGEASGYVKTFCGEKEPGQKETSMVECRRQVVPAVAQLLPRLGRSSSAV